MTTGPGDPTIDDRVADSESMVGTDPNPRPQTNDRVTLAVLAAIALGFALQQSLVVPALTTIQRDLGASSIATTWLVTGFLLSSSVATPIIGRLGDMFGRSRIMLISLAILAFGTVLAAVAPTIGLLIAARIFQGLAGAVVPLTFGIVRDEMSPSKVPGSIGIISALLAVGAATGIVFSGPIVTGLGVRWLFWLPMIALVPTMFAAWKLIPTSTIAQREPIDFLGGFLLTGWLVCFLVAVSQASDWGWLGGKTVLLYLGAVLSFAGWVRTELRCEIPLIDIRLLSQRTMAGVNFISFSAGFTMQALFTFIPRFVQIPESSGFGLGISASNAGLVILPWSLGAFLTGMFSGRFAARFGSRKAMLVGAVVTLIPSLVLTQRHDALMWILLATGATGVGTGFVTAAMPAIIVSYVASEQTGVAAGMNQNIRTIGGAVGTQVFAAVIAAHTLNSERAYSIGFAVVGGVCALGAIGALLVPKSQGRSLRETMSTTMVTPRRT